MSHCRGTQVLVETMALVVEVMPSKIGKTKMKNLRMPISNLPVALLIPKFLEQ